MYIVPPIGWEKAQESPDENSGHWPGWFPVGDGPEDCYHREAFAVAVFPDGTYELLGPKVQGNPEGFTAHTLVRHGSDVLAADSPRDFTSLRKFFEVADIEGIVWRHPDGRMVKIKKKDFGLKRNR